MGEFGDKFRKAREKKELSLDDVSNVTKISSRMLRAIEEEHFDDLPGGVFNKGFIRAYAKHLGLDSEEAVTDYLASLRQAQIDAQQVWDAQPSGPTRSGSNGKPRPKEAGKVASKPATGKAPAPVEIEDLHELQLPRAEDVHPARKEFADQASSGTPWRIVLAAALVAGLGISLWVRHSSRTHAADTSTTNLRSTPAQAAVPALASAPVAATSPLASEPTNSKAPVDPTTPQPAAKSSAQPAPQPSPDQRKVDSSDVTVTNLAKSPSKPPQKAALALSLVIRAAENSWVSASADGQLVTEETLIAPAHTSVRAAREISVRVGNAAGVSFIFNGQEIAAQGAEAEVRNYIFDSGGMHTSSAITAVP